jgi:prephenate dehydrogenase
VSAFVPFDRLAVLGLGLLGGSVAWAARVRGAARQVVGCGRQPAPLREARARGLVDAWAVEPAEAVRDADLVVLATPVGAMAGVLRSAAPALRAGTLVTDVGSVKGLLAETLPGIVPPGVRYVGSHPMAGSHEKGPGHARPDLLEGATCVVAASPGDPPEAVARLAAFWSALGARVVRRDPATHDLEVAWISHVPHALAFAFARALGDAPPGAGELAGTGFRTSRASPAAIPSCGRRSWSPTARECRARSLASRSGSQRSRGRSSPATWRRRTVGSPRRARASPQPRSNPFRPIRRRTQSGNPAAPERAR